MATPTAKQKDYLLILFHNCLIQTHNGRTAWLTKRLKRLVRDLDDLCSTESSIVINELKEIRRSLKGKNG